MYENSYINAVHLLFTITNVFVVVCPHDRPNR